MSGDKSSTWKDFYRAALLEVDDAKLPARLEQALQIIGQRRSELLQQGDNTHPEHRELLDALQNLRVLRREIP